MTKFTKYLLILPLVVFGCSDEADTEEFRTLPVAAQTADGGEVLVGTYDEASNTLELVPAFVAEIEGVTEGLALGLVAGDEILPFAREGVVDLGEGSTLDIVAGEPNERWIGGQLIVHAPGWTDGLTEAEVASAFPGCFDPCSFPQVCSPE